MKLKFSSRKIVLTIVFVIFVLYALSLVYPFVWAFFNSLKTHVEYDLDSFSLPKSWLFSNYIEAFDYIKLMNTATLTETKFFGLFFNSLWFTLGTTSVNLISCTMTAYVVSKYNFKLKNFIYSLAIFIMLIPIVGNLPATNLLYSMLGIKNSPLIIVAYTGGFGFNFIILYGFFKNVSWSYAEAGFIDGATNLKVFLFVMIPQAMPAILSLFIITAIGQWNDYMTPLLFLRDYPTLASGLFFFKEKMLNIGANYPVYFAGILLSTLPILILYICFSETIMTNTVAGGLKG